MEAKRCINCGKVNIYHHENNLEDFTNGSSCTCYSSRTSIVKYNVYKVVNEDLVSVKDIQAEQWTNVTDPSPCRIVNPVSSKQWQFRKLSKKITLGLSSDKDFHCWTLTGSQSGKRVYIFSKDESKYVSVNDQNELVLEEHDVSPRDINVDTDDELGDRRAFYEILDNKRNEEGYLLVPAFKQDFAVTKVTHFGRDKLKITERDALTYMWKIIRE